MSPDELAAHVREATGAVEGEEVARGQVAIRVPADRYHEVATHLKECGRCRFDFFTFLSAVDWEEEGLEVVCHLYSIRRQHHINLTCLLPREEPQIASLSDLWRGALWHERETAEMFGVRFEGHPALVKLLLPDAFDGHPLRKDFLLMSREVKEWPGVKEPEEQAPDPSPEEAKDR